MSDSGSDVLLARLLALHPRLIDLSLDRMWRLLAALDHPQDKTPPIIHIAGTNGKGSTAAMLRAILETEGHRVHAYHSPHLTRFHERIILGGEPIAEPLLEEILARVEAANQGRPITFFEVTTAAAFLAFSEYQADYLVLEVGLGGRLDATNVVTPKCTAITPISFDHQEFLGDTLLSIAEEKAGILKAGVPLFLAPQQSEVEEFLLTRAARTGAVVKMAGRDFRATATDAGLAFAIDDEMLALPQPALRGAHQIDNAATALACAHYLGIGAAAMATGLQTVRWPGRLQKLTRGPMLSALTARLPEADVYLDGGHNEAAAHILADWLLAQKPRPVHVVLAMLASKAHDPYLAALARVQAAGRNLHIHAVPIADNENALAPQDLVAAARQAGCAATAQDNPAAALATISEPDALVLIAGSLYLAGAVLQNHQ
ncbi:MAG: bifunctional folylpolyglutamate synthase/dihydrofolate synthase [Alphaproteobacteria bacterium]|nr:bifunctional folylpolyglutamate synthase/dihydrofolate synthase [Alphaproteobacteria bacterium]